MNAPIPEEHSDNASERPPTFVGRIFDAFAKVCAVIVFGLLGLLFAVFAFEALSNVDLGHRRFWFCLVIAVVVGLVIAPVIAGYVASAVLRWSVFGVIVAVGATVGAFWEYKRGS